MDAVQWLELKVGLLLKSNNSNQKQCLPIAMAVFTHCNGHALNLSASDMIKQCSSMKDCFNTGYELVEHSKYSPKTETILICLKEEIGSYAPSLRTLCPTRWRVHANSLDSALENDRELESLWDELVLLTQK